MCWFCYESIGVEWLFEYKRNPDYLADLDNGISQVPIFAVTDLVQLIKLKVYENDMYFHELVCARLFQEFLMRGFDANYSKAVLNELHLLNEAQTRAELNNAEVWSILTDERAWHKFVNTLPAYTDKTQKALLSQGEGCSAVFEQFEAGEVLDRHLSMLVAYKSSIKPLKVFEQVAVLERPEMNYQCEAAYYLLLVAGIQRFLEIFRQHGWLRLEVLMYALWKSAAKHDAVTIAYEWLQKNRTLVTFYHCQIGEAELEVFKKQMFLRAK